MDSPTGPQIQNSQEPLSQFLLILSLDQVRHQGAMDLDFIVLALVELVSYRPSLKDIIKKQGKNRFLGLLQEYPETGVHYLYKFPFTGDKLSQVSAPGKVVIVLLVCIWCFGHWEFAIMSMFPSLLLLLGILRVTSPARLWQGFMDAFCVLISLHLMLFSTYFLLLWFHDKDSVLLYVSL